MIMNKTTVKIIVSILALGLMIGSYFLIKKLEKAKQEGTITVVIVDEMGGEKSQKISFQENDTLVGVLQKHFEITIENGKLLRIENLETDFLNAFIMIYINGSPARMGIEQIALKDKAEIRFVYTKVAGGQS
jgi:hypothetical protein